MGRRYMIDAPTSPPSGFAFFLVGEGGGRAGVWFLLQEFFVLPRISNSGKDLALVHQWDCKSRGGVGFRE